MKHSLPNRSDARRLSARILATATLALCLGLLVASPASAGYEQVANFAGKAGVLHPSNYAEWPEEVQLGGVGGMAVNYTGAGGVPKGTVYAATKLPGSVRVAMYEPNQEKGGLKFVESWQMSQVEGNYERCGPLLGTKLVGGEEVAEFPCQPQSDSGAVGVDVDVDQATGNVYVLNVPFFAGKKAIAEFKADGSEEITRFGEKAAEGKTVAETPGQVHVSQFNGGIAVNGAGDVYLYDETSAYHRLMVFSPKAPGDFSEYAYAGEVLAQAPNIFAPVADAAGNLYVRGNKIIKEYAPEAPAPYPAPSPAPPRCEYEFARSELKANTVDPLTGEVFFSSGKDHNHVHRLAPCAGGKFEELGAIAFSPNRTELTGLAFDPDRQIDPDRPPGVLYAGASGGEGGETGEDGKGTALVESSLGYVFSHPAAVPPEVASEAAGHVTSSSAGLLARINPKGSATRYVFQYETEAAYEANEPAERFAGATEVPPGGALLGEGNKTLGAAVSLTSLAPDTAYRFRAVAMSHCSEEEPGKTCVGTGEAEAFRTFPTEAPGLPDHRAYELVSPPRKEGGQVLPAEPAVSSCGLTLCKPGEFATRFPREIAPGGNAVVYEGTSFSGEEGGILENEYIARRDPKTGWQTTNLTPPQLYSRNNIDGYKAFSADLSRGVLSQPNLHPTLAPEAPGGFWNVYSQSTSDPLARGSLLDFEPPNRLSSEYVMRYAGASEDLSRIFFEANDALTPEGPFAPEASDGGKAKNNLYEWHEGELALVNVAPGNAETHPGASFGDPNAHSISSDGSRAFFEDEAHQVFVRIDGEQTKEIETEGAPDPGRFLAASTDGSRVLLQNGHLHGLGDEEPTVDLTEGKGGFLGIAGQSDDLSHLYFVDTEVLSGEEESEQHAKAQQGEDNLYAWAEGQGTRFVATLTSEDNHGRDGGDWVAFPGSRTAEASPSGRYVAFKSSARLTGYDNTGPCALVGETLEFASGACPEAFLYDFQTGRLSCASCNRSDTRPLGWSILRTVTFRYLTDEGRLYFDSRDSLVPADTNEGVEDVYQYEPQGTGTCEREGGCVSLISAGAEPFDSNLLTVDEGGRNVLFTTRDKLALKDTDGLIDLYDAREGGGIPGESETSRGECQGEACQPQVSVPNDPTPGSSTFEGAGNVKEESKAKKHSKKHKKKRHAKKHAHKRAAKHNRGGQK